MLNSPFALAIGAVLSCAAATAPGGDGWTDDFAAAKVRAAKEGKDLLVDFTGSDWCHWCIKLSEEVFEHEAFEKEASKDFVFVELDFPRRKQLAPEVKEQNAALQAKFGIQGFPTVLLMDAEGRPYAYAAGSARTLRRSLALMTFMPLTTTLVVTLIGLAAIPRFQDLGAVEADRVMPLLLGEWAVSGPLFAVAAVLVFIGALAAIMSTADSVLLSLGSQVAEDVLGRSHRDDATTRLGKRIAAGVMVAMALLALVARDVTLWGLIELKMELLIQCVPAFLIALHWRGLRAGPACLGLLAGTALAVAGVFLDVKTVDGVHVGVIGLGVNVAIAVIGSLWEARAAGQGQSGTKPRSAHSF